MSMPRSLFLLHGLAFTYDAEGKIDGVNFEKSETGTSNDYKFGSNLGLGLGSWGHLQA